MFDLKKTILLAVMIVAVVMTFVAGYTVGNKIGYNNGESVANLREHALIIRQDSLMRKQTELCHQLMDQVYLDKCEMSH